jgi:hypothetical protein
LTLLAAGEWLGELASDSEIEVERKMAWEAEMSWTDQVDRG